MAEPRESFPIEEQRGTAEEFLDRLAEADGASIHLRGKKSRLGEDFYICARAGSVTYWGPSVERLLIVDMLVKPDDWFVPIAHYDWEIKGNQASGNKNRHGHLPTVTTAHIVADSFWETGEGFKVEDASFINYAMANGSFAKMGEMTKTGLISNEEQWREPVYQKYNIGSFMVAVSAYILQKQGVVKREFVSASGVAKRAWKRFGVIVEDKHHTLTGLPQVTDHPYFKQVVEEFTGLPFAKME